MNYWFGFISYFMTHRLTFRCNDCFWMSASNYNVTPPPLLHNNEVVIETCLECWYCMPIDPQLAKDIVKAVCPFVWCRKPVYQWQPHISLLPTGAVAVTYELMGESPPIVRVSACNGTEPNLFACNETIPPASSSGSGSGDVEEQLTGSCSHFAGVRCNSEYNIMYHS